MKYFIVNAFADKPFCGNPAAVCIVENDLSENKMQLIALETAFIEKKSSILSKITIDLVQKAGFLS